MSGLQLVESCSCIWIFNPALHRFRRVPRNARLRLDVPAPWAAYHHFEIDERRSVFTVTLNRRGTRLLRACLHGDPCTRCEGRRSA